MRDNIFCPLFSCKPFQKDHVSKLIERHVTPLENTTHQMFFTTEKAVGGPLLMLPYRTEAFLHINGVWEFTNLLELIYAYNNAFLFFYSDIFCQLKNLFRIAVIPSDSEKSELGSGLMEIFGVSRIRKSRALSIHRSAEEAVCFSTAAAKAL